MPSGGEVAIYGKILVRAWDWLEKRKLLNEPKKLRQNLENILDSTNELCEELRSKIYNERTDENHDEYSAQWDDYKSLSNLIGEFKDEVFGKKNGTVYETARDLKNDIKYLEGLGTYLQAPQNFLADQLAGKQEIKPENTEELTGFIRDLKFNYKQISQNIDIDLEHNVKQFETSCETPLKEYIHHQRTHREGEIYVKEAKLDRFINTFLSSMQQSSIKYESPTDEYNEIQLEDINITNPWFKEGIKLTSKKHNFKGFIGYVSNFSYKKHVIKETKDKDKKHMLFYVVDTLEKTTADAIKDSYGATNFLYVYNLDDNTVYYNYKDYHTYANKLLFTGGCVRNFQEWNSKINNKR